MASFLCWFNAAFGDVPGKANIVRGHHGFAPLSCNLTAYCNDAHRTLRCRRASFEARLATACSSLRSRSNHSSNTIGVYCSTTTAESLEIDLQVLLRMLRADPVHHSTMPSVTRMIIVRHQGVYAVCLMANTDNEGLALYQTIVQHPVKDR